MEPDSSGRKQTYVASATFKLKPAPSRTLSSSTISKEQQRPGLRRIRSSSVLVEGAGLPAQTAVPPDLLTKARHVSSVSIALRKSSTGRASSEPKDGNFGDLHPGSVEMFEGVDNRSEAVLNYPQTTRQTPNEGDEGLVGNTETADVATLEEKTFEDAQSKVKDDRDGVANVDHGIHGSNEGQRVVQRDSVQSSSSVVFRSWVDVDGTRGSHRRTSSDTEFVVFARKSPRERRNGTRPRSQEVDMESVLAVSKSRDAHSGFVIPQGIHTRSVDREQPGKALNKTSLGNESGTITLCEENKVSGDNTISSDKSEVEVNQCLKQEGPDMLEAPILSESASRDDHEVLPPRKGGMPKEEMGSPSNPDVVNSNDVSNDGKEMCTLGSQNDHAPDVHLYNDQNGRLHVVVDASKFSSTLSPHVVSGMKATLSDSRNAEVLSSQELAESTHITLRRRTSLSQAMENSVMPAWREAIRQRAELQREDLLQEESRSGSPQLPVKKPARKDEIRRANSADVIPFDSLDVEHAIVRNRSGSDRVIPRPASAAVFKTEEGEVFLSTPSRNSIACQAEVHLTDMSSSGSHKKSVLTITAPGGSKVILQPPVKSKNDLTEEDMRQHVLMNLVETEISYVRSLKTLIQVYFEPLKKPRTPTLIDAGLVDEIFYQIPNLRSCHELFLQQLTERVSEWHNQQKIGDIFVNQFSKCMLSDAYAAFINHYLQAKEAVRMAVIQRPAFSKFLEHCSREHSDKLTLNDLLIQPVQRIPRYVLLLKDMLKHTPQDHPDHDHLLSAVSELTTLAEKMDQGEWEAAEAEKLKELESTFEGHVLLTETKRYVLCQETVGQVLDYEQIKERSLILLSDFVVCASIRRSRGSTFRKRGSSLFSLGLSPSPNLFEIKHKLLWKASFGDITLIKSLEASVPMPYTSLVLPPSLTGGSAGRRTSIAEKSTVERLHHDSACLQQITKLVKQLYIHHAQLDTAVRELESEVREQIEVQKQTELQLSLVKARLGIVLHNSGESLAYTLQFSSEQRKKAWIEEFEEAKKKQLAAEDTSITWNAPVTASISSSDKNGLSKDKVFSPPEPQFHKCIPLMKTRSGMRISCAATSISPVLSPHGGLGSGNLWICASDGCVGQVGIVTVKGSSPNEMVCITVCACRITCIVPVPEMDPNCRKERRESTVGPLHRISAETSVHRSSSDLIRDRGRVPVIVRRTHSFGDRARSSSQPMLSQRGEEPAFRFYSLTLASSFMRLYGQRQGEMSELFQQLSSLPGPESEACLYPEATGNEMKSQSSVDIHTHHESSPPLSSGSIYSTPVSSPATALGVGAAVRGASPAAIAHTEIPEETVPSLNASKPDLHSLKGPTMWLGTEEGLVLVYHAGDSIRVRQNKMKMEFGSAVLALSYMKERIFVSLEGCVMYAISRSEDGGWDVDNKEKVVVGDGNVSVTCMKPVLDCLWCGGGNIIHIVSPVSLKTERFFQAHSDHARLVTHIASAELAAWLAFQKSSEVKLFNAFTLQQLAVLDVRPEVKRILQGSNSIVRQHKIAQLRVTCLQPCEGLLWIGTSAGAMLTLRMPVIDEDTASVLELPSLSSSYHGHTGLVRFVSAIKKPDDDEGDDWTQYDVSSGESISRCVSLPKLTKSKSKEEEIISLNLNVAHARTLSDMSQRAASECTLYSKSESSFDQGMDAPVDQRIVVVSGGDGFEDFRTSGDDQVVGRDDSTSHILTWLI